MHVMGIDAGATKTLGLLADAAGAIVDEARGAGANLHVAGEEGVAATLGEVIAAAVGGRAVKLDAVCVGIAGVDRDDEAGAVHAIVRGLCPGSRVVVVNDALIALAAGAHDAPGIVIVAGTGSIVYGRNGADQAARAGGWGHMVGDEGSGF